MLLPNKISPKTTLEEPKYTKLQKSCSQAALGLRKWSPASQACHCCGRGRLLPRTGPPLPLTWFQQSGQKAISHFSRQGRKGKKKSQTHIARGRERECRMRLAIMGLGRVSGLRLLGSGSADFVLDNGLYCPQARPLLQNWKLSRAASTP